MRRLLGPAVGALLLLFLAWVVAALRPSWSEVVWTVAVLVLFGAAALAVVSQARALGPEEASELDRLLRRTPPARPRPPDLERLEHVLGWRSYSPQDFSYRVRSLFEDLIRYRLAARRGIDLARDQDLANEVLPPELRNLLVRDLSHDSGGRTITTDDMARLVEQIDNL